MLQIHKVEEQHSLLHTPHTRHLMKISFLCFPHQLSLPLLKMLNCLLKQSHNFASRHRLHSGGSSLPRFTFSFCSDSRKNKFLSYPQGTFKLILQKTYTFHVDVESLVSPYHRIISFSTSITQKFYVIFNTMRI